MPTENRSSNTEMVRDSEMTECQFHNNCGGWCETRRELEHNLCEHCLESHDEEMAEPATAPQPRPEPATPYGWHVEWADSGDHYLFTKVEKRIEALRLDSDVKVVQLFDRADPVEVGQLRDQLSAWQALAAERLDLLAERDALLSRVLDHLKAGKPGEAQVAICSALSGSAEPKAPALSIPEGYCIMPRQLTAENGAKALLLGEFKLEVTQECPECRELDEPLEGCEICDGEGEYGQRHIVPWVKIKYIYSEAVRGLAIKTDANRDPA